MSRWKLFIDDNAGKPGMEAFRNPPKGEHDWKIARSSEEAKQLVIEFGIPAFIDFDHDLGRKGKREDKATHFIKWFQQTYPDAIREIEGWSIHSKNEPGARVIESLMNSWKRSVDLP